MNLRKSLIATTAGIITLGFVLACSSFAASLKPNALADNNDTVVIARPALTPGVPIRIKVAGRYVLLFSPTIAQWSDLKNLNTHVASAQFSNWSAALGAFAYWGNDPHSGYILVEKSIEDAKKEGFWAEIHWVGGYSDPEYDVSYDYAGRVITDENYAMFGKVLSQQSLKPLNLEALGSDKLVVHLHRTDG